MSKVCEWSEVAAQGGKGRRIVRWHGRTGGKARNEVAILGKVGRLVSREGGIEFKDKVVLYCSREAKCEQGFTAGIL